MVKKRKNIAKRVGKRIRNSKISDRPQFGEILSQGVLDISKLHKEEIESRRDKKLNSKITSLFYSTLLCIIFALIIFFNLKSYDLTSGFRFVMSIIMIIFVILTPILGARLIVLYLKHKSHKR